MTQPKFDPTKKLPHCKKASEINEAKKNKTTTSYFILSVPGNSLKLKVQA